MSSSNVEELLTGLSVVDDTVGFVKVVADEESKGELKLVAWAATISELVVEIVLLTGSSDVRIVT